ncbi:MAG: helix-turn-helix transcriptional regulator [Butyrivibrio sp.]|nr:helix-turn-helix transcriptional regulator [Butyrivibrio sp.]
MIDYGPFWHTVESSGESWYSLSRKHLVNNNTLSRLRNNQPLNTSTIDRLCTLFCCDVSGIMRYRRD